MPVEIKELIIRAVVTDEHADRPDAKTASPHPEADHEALVQECVRQVLKILERSRER